MKTYLKIILGLTIVLQSYFISGQTNNLDLYYDSIKSHYDKLAQSDLAQLEPLLYQHLRSNNENDWIIAAQYFGYLGPKKEKLIDSINKVAVVKFPLGVIARKMEWNNFIWLKDPVKMEALYKAWIEKYPKEKFGKDRGIYNNTGIYDNALMTISLVYVNKDNFKKALQYAGMVEYPFWKAGAFEKIGSKFAENGDLSTATKILSGVVADLYRIAPSSIESGGSYTALRHYFDCSIKLAGILNRQKKYKEALKFLREAHDHSKLLNAENVELNSNYARTLLVMGQDKEAFQIYQDMVSAGKASPEIKENLHQLYVKVKGSGEGYDEFMASLNKILSDKLREELSKKMINLPAPGFSLLDLEGKSVSLTDLKDKVVVLDFWAMWCGPCKASFPAMKKAVEKYKEDGDVKFLFIHTLENDPASLATQKAKDYIAEKNYPFEVLMDLRDVKGANKMALSYEVSSIPRKFVIDKNGNIRFKINGFNGGEDATVEEIAVMIDLVRSMAK